MRKLFALLISLPFALQAATLGEDGFYDDPLFSESFLDFAEDAQMAADEGKYLMVVVEQVGCPYCREMHEVNMQQEDIRAEIAENFLAIQLDLFGAKEVTDFDGNTMEERDFALKHQVFFTPTLMFFDQNGEEVFRLPGYFKPFHHMTALEFVSSGAYERTDFQRFLGERVEAVRAEGEEVKIWQ